jgi:hypothetical protein
MSTVCSLCNDVRADCRVDLPRIGGGECAIDPGKIGDLGSKVYINQNNVIYQRRGVVVREFNHEGLRLPQKREFLGPEFFNSGCATLYGNSRFTQGPNSATTDPAYTLAMFNHNFAPRPYYEGNDVNCVNAGAKCISPNSALGWMLDQHETPLWMSQIQKDSTLTCT